MHPAAEETPDADPLQVMKPALASDLAYVAARDHWGRALIAIGWIHLAFFSVGQACYTSGHRSNELFLGLWLIQFAVVVWSIRRIAGRGWFRTTPLAGVVMRVWVTFLILSFNVASMNTLTGFTLDWFKPVWATLSTFGFAVMAYLLSYWFFVFAVQMYFTGLLMVWLPAWNYVIYGLSWCLALNVLGIVLERKRGQILDRRGANLGKNSGHEAAQAGTGQLTIHVGLSGSYPASALGLPSVTSTHPQPPRLNHLEPRQARPAFDRP